MIDYIELILENHPEVKVNCLGDRNNYNNITFLSGSVTQAALDSEYLSLYKKKKNAEIDTRTRELIDQGFVYDSELFSASETAQRNWLAVDQFRSDLTYPYAVSTKADGEYELADAVEVHNFVLTGLGTIEYHYGGGRALKQSVNAATDIAGVDAVVDNR